MIVKTVEKNKKCILIKNWLINLQTQMNFVMEILISFCCYEEKSLPLKYMDSLERFHKAFLPDKKAFYSDLNIEDILDVDYRHAKKVFKVLNTKI